ncbi:unnamed protein product [Closterium sp. Naga37s-1]|nr:unnamed protein product [Closterium sp. Naga37s-1]
MARGTAAMNVAASAADLSFMTNAPHAPCMSHTWRVPAVDAKAVLVGYGPLPWSFYVHQSWRQPVIRPGDVLVFKWGFWPHGVRKLASGTAYDNCDFSGSTKVAPIRFFGYARYTVQAGDAATGLYFACPVPSHCGPGGMKVQISVTPL